ncbi:MAG TPA: hypothetical protein PL163_13230 [Leptospiraceae bacterium]|nr:hypothetical protein [Leptospiraceae bacterium]
MSRLEEFSAEQSGKKIRSYSLAHPRKDKSTFSIPVVNHLFIDLKSLISASFSALKFGRKKKPTIEFSHDIDYIRKTIQLRLKQTAFNSFKTLRSVSRPASFFQNFRKTFSFFLSSPDYWPFDFWEQADAKYNIQSVFYIYAAAGQKNFRSWLIDPSYDIRRDRTVRNALRRLISMGFKAGLHGSYRSAVSEIQLKTEKEILAETSGTEITMTRQHWLNYEENITPYIHEKLFAFDSTLGWNDRIGFRSGFASQYRPYDHRNRRPFDYFITPQIIMDSNIYDYGSGRESELENKSVQILENLESFSSSFVSISWHDRVFTEDYGWFPFYERIQKLYG